MILRVKGWSRFQHYKHRRPPWIRLYRELLDDVTWHRLPIASRALAPMLWLLASETQEGSIDGDSDALAFRLHVASSELDEALNPLIAAGWIIKSDPASVLLAPRKQHATSESEIRDQSTDNLTAVLTDPARGSALVNGSAPRAIPTMNERMKSLAEKHRKMSPH